MPGLQKAGDFEISIDHLDGELENASIYLKDNLLNTIHDLKQSSYQVNISTLGNIDNRFELLFRRNALATNENILKNNINIFNQNNFIKLNAYKQISSIKIYNVLGKLLTNKNTNSKEVTLTDNYKTGSVLLFKITFSDGTTTNKKFIKL